MEMELMDNGLPLEAQTTQPDAVPEVEPDSVGTMESAEAAEALPEEPPKRKRTTRKKAEKVEEVAPDSGDTMEGGENPPMPENMPLEYSPLDEDSSEADHLDPEPGVSAEDGPG